MLVMTYFSRSCCVTVYGGKIDVAPLQWKGFLCEAYGETYFSIEISFSIATYSVYRTRYQIKVSVVCLLVKMISFSDSAEEP